MRQVEKDTAAALGLSGLVSGEYLLGQKGHLLRRKDEFCLEAKANFHEYYFGRIGVGFAAIRADEHERINGFLFCSGLLWGKCGFGCAFFLF